MQTPFQGTILVVDDEEGMRSLLEALLDSAGIDSLCVSNAKSAVAVLAGNQDRIKGCLLDMNLEDSTGEDLYDELKAISPSLLIFPMSGIFGDEIRERLGKREIAGLIAKPFSAKQLIDTVQQGLARSSES